VQQATCSSAVNDAKEIGHLNPKRSFTHTSTWIKENELAANDKNSIPMN